ncbi:hypothetical protein AB0454_22805 [Streptomyces sp. NPDC093509]|uniref:hypothetical protein n=1 Tax=Streptomyces sp. NPDC093509 TaxID=3154982 RepID=UPI00344C13A9
MPKATPVPAPVEESSPTHSGLQITLAVFGMSLIGTVVGAALFGNEEQSERAFRLLHWWKRDPEPDQEKPAAGSRAKRHS